ncbi:hypothetical protein ACTXT7_015199, partial [Hymenolepis weldensis]
MGGNQVTEALKLSFNLPSYLVCAFNNNSKKLDFDELEEDDDNKEEKEGYFTYNLLKNILETAVMCEIVNLIVTPDFLPINVVCTQVAHPHRSEKLSVPRMIVAEAPLTLRYFRISTVYAVPSFSYNRPVQLKHAHNHVLTRVLIQ